MKKFSLIIILSLLVLNSNSQTKTQGSSSTPINVNFSDSTIPDYNPNLHSIDKQPIPASEYGDKKEQLHKQRLEILSKTGQKKNSNGSNVVNPEILKAYEGNIANGSPSDNDIAVSDSGIVISALNTNISIYNDTGKLLLNKSLSQLVSQMGNYTQTSDPRILYDPLQDRFVFVCFSGSLSTTNTILIGFSKTNNPAGNWNFYKFSGNPFKDTTWSDYPIIAISGSDLFITFNQVKDNVHWSVGFKQSVIWQIDKNRGYNGDTLQYTLWSDIKHNGTNIRNICPAKYQTYNPNDNMYFLSVKNVSSSNDTIFLLELTNSFSSGKATLNQKVLKSPVKYGFPPNAIQKKSTSGIHQQLMTNDARVLAAIYENDYIHFGSNTINPNYTNAGVLIGTIQNVKNSTPIIKTKIFSTNDIEYGYPSMTYMGKVASDHKVLYTFSHCFTDSFPGMSMMYQDATENFSDITNLKAGVSNIDMFADSIERWGDYSNSQRIYNKTNQAYIIGSWGQINRMKTWVAKIEVNDTTKAPNPSSAINSVENSELIFNIYPNPSIDIFTTNFILDKKESIHFYLTDIQGNLIANLLLTDAYKGSNEFSFNTSSLSAGTYILVLKGETGTYLSRKIQKIH